MFAVFYFFTVLEAVLAQSTGLVVNCDTVWDFKICDTSTFDVVFKRKWFITNRAYSYPGLAYSWPGDLTGNTSNNIPNTTHMIAPLATQHSTQQ